jgi:predicted nucleic acid binding AN1-type Zn finger protein
MSNRCKQCNHKGSFLLKCKCNNYYCTKHLLPELHKCTELQSFKKEAFEKNEKILLESAKKEKPEWVI